MSMSLDGLSPIGDAFQVNTGAAGNQTQPTSTALQGGGTVSIWRSDGTGGGTSALLGQRLDGTGAKAGDAFFITGDLSSAQTPFVTALSDGGFAVTWTSTTDAAPFGAIYVQRFDAGGLATGDALEVTAPSSTVRTAPGLAERADGGLTVIWQSLDQDGSNWGIFARHIDPSGSLSGTETQVNVVSLNAQSEPAVTTLSDGRQLVVWSSVSTDGTSAGIAARFLDADGAHSVGEFWLSEAGSAQSHAPAVAELADGTLVATWQDNVTGTIRGRVFDSAGAPLVAEFRVDAGTGGQALAPEVAAVPTGGFLVVYQAQGAGTGSSEIFGQLFDGTGQKIGAVRQINSFEANVQSAPTVTLLADGTALVSWESNTQDGDGYGIFSQVLLLNEATTGTVEITGSAEELQILTATALLEDLNGLGTTSYRWYRAGELVQDSDAATYQLTQADVGAAITVVAVHTDQDGFVDLIESTPTAPIANVNDPATGTPLITGELRVGQVLAVDVTTIADSDGIAGIGYAWKIGGTLVAGATGQSISLSEAHYGKTVTAIVTVTDGSGAKTVFEIETQGAVEETPRGLLLTQEVDTALLYEVVPDATIRVDNDTAFAIFKSKDGMTIAAIDLSTGTEIARGSFGGIFVGWYQYQAVVTSGSVGDRAYLVFQGPHGEDGYLRLLSVENGEVVAQDVLLGARAQLESGYYQPEDVIALNDETLIAVANSRAQIIDISDGTPTITDSFVTNDGQGTKVIPLTDDLYVLIKYSSYWYSGTFRAEIRSLSDETVVPIDLGQQSDSRYGTSPQISQISLQAGENGQVYLDFQKYTDYMSFSQVIQRVVIDPSGPEVISSFTLPGGNRTDPSPDYLDDADLQSDGVILQPTFVETESGEYRLVLQSYALNAAPEGQPAILGAAEQGNTLLADTSAISDANGLGGMQIAWWRDGVQIEGATSDTYRLVQRDVGHEIRVMVTFSDGEGRTEHVLSAPSTPVANVNDAAIGGLFVYETTDGALSVYTKGLQDPDGLGELSLQWLRDGTPISGATGTQYQPTGDDTGKALSIRVSYTDAQGTPEEVEGILRASLHGTPSANTLFGTGAAETLFGQEGPDVLIGGGGEDLLVGGEGNDWLSGEAAPAASHGLTIANQVFRLYQAALARTPDVTGHARWSERLASGERTLLEVAEGFVTSPEFQKTYKDLSDRAFVGQLYWNVLDRGADAGGRARWISELEHGKSRAEVLLGFSQSQEFINKTGAQANAFALDSPASDWVDDVYRLYQATLDREPDVTGLQNWSTRLGTGMDFEKVVAGFVQSAEFQKTYGALNDSAFVTLLYTNVMGRDPDEAGFARWTRDLASGVSREAVVRGFSQSPEFTTATKAPLEAWMRAQGTDDVLDGGAGSNTLFGGLLSDTFVFDADQQGTHRVMDLEAWDSLSFLGFGYASDADVLAHISQIGGDVVFEDQGTRVTLVGVRLDDITDDMIL